jgi:hypothetical protein
VHDVMVAPCGQGARFRGRIDLEGGQ